MRGGWIKINEVAGGEMGRMGPCCEGMREAASNQAVAKVSGRGMCADCGVIWWKSAKLQAITERSPILATP